MIAVAESMLDESRNAVTLYERACQLTGCAVLHTLPQLCELRWPLRIRLWQRVAKILLAALAGSPCRQHPEERLDLTRRAMLLTALANIATRNTRRRTTIRVVDDAVERTEKLECALRTDVGQIEQRADRVLIAGNRLLAERLLECLFCLMRQAQGNERNRRSAP